MSKKEQAVYINQQLQIGLANTYANLLAFKKYKNSPLIISRDGRIVAVPADEMPPARPLE